MLSYYAIGVFAALLTAVCQLLLKVGAVRGLERRSLVGSYLNLYTMGGYFLLFVVTILNVYIYRVLPLKAAVMLLPLTFVAVALLSLCFLREQLSTQRIVGSVVIIAGIVAFHL